MGNINYDSFYKFLVSLGIILIVFPCTAILFLFTDSFNLQISDSDLATYTETAQKVIKLKQSIPLLIEKWYVWLVFAIFVIAGFIFIFCGLKQWHELQKLDDICKKREAEKVMKAVNQNTVEMSDDQIIQKNTHHESTSSIVMKGFIVEQRFFNLIKNTKDSYLVKSNIMIGNCEYDVVAFSNQHFAKDYIYEVKYWRKEVTLNRIEQCREQMQKLKDNFSEKLNRIPYMVLAIIVPDELYEHALNTVQKVKKWNNYSVELIKESDLPEK